MSSTPTSTDSTLAQTFTNALPGVLQAGSQVYGAQNAAEASTKGQQASIAQQQTTLGNINGIWANQQRTGQGANTALQSALGTNGQPANYSGFENMPGYQFAVQQGTQAINRQSAAMGNAYTPNTAAAVGQYVTGTAMSDYNTYIQQLMGAAGLGTTANQGLQTGQQNTGDNISQSQQNIGNAQASGVMGASQAVSGAFNPTGVGTSLIGQAGKYLFGNNTGTSTIGTPVGGYNSPSPNGGGNTVQDGGNSGNYGANSSQYGANDSYTGAGDGTFGSGVNPYTGQPYVDPTAAPTFDPNANYVTTPDFGNINIPSVDIPDDGGGDDGLDYIIPGVRP